MNIAELLEHWKDTQTIVELHYIQGGRKKVVHGRIYSFDFRDQNILFYNDDTKSVENILLTQIEDAIARDTQPKAVPVPEEPVQAVKAEPEAAAPAKAGKKNMGLKEEIVEFIESMSTQDLYALLPLVKHMARNSQRKMPNG